MTQTADTVHRTFPMPETIREAMRASRDRAGLSTKEYIGQAVATYLPWLIEELRGLGFGGPQGVVRPARLPFSARFGTLDAVRKGSEEVQVPAFQLLLLCLAGAAEGRPTRTGRKGRKGQPGRQRRSAARGGSTETASGAEPPEEAGPVVPVVPAAPPAGRRRRGRPKASAAGDG